MPPVGYIDRSSFFKKEGPTEEQIYWSGPVSERAPSLLQQPPPPQYASTNNTSSSAPILNDGVTSGGSSLSAVDSGNGESRSRQVLRASSSRDRRRMKRPASASSISVLSMLAFERKASNKTRRPQSSVGQSHRHNKVNAAEEYRNKKLAESFAYANTASAAASGLASRRPHSAVAVSTHKTNKGVIRKATSRTRPRSRPTESKSNPKLNPKPSRTASIVSSLDSISIASSVLSTNKQEKEQAPMIPISTVDDGAAPQCVPNTKVLRKKRKKKKKKKQAPSNLEWATAFLGRVEQRLESEAEMYKAFVDALREGDGTLASVQTIATAVLLEHPDLMQELDDYVRQSMATQRQTKRNLGRAKSARRARLNTSEVQAQLTTTAPSSATTGSLRRRKKIKHWNWILDVAKTPKLTAMKKVTLKRLQKIPNKIDPAEWNRPKSSYPTGRYRGAAGGSGKFSTAFPMTNLELTILNASRCPGPSEYQDPTKKRVLPGGEFSTSYPKSDVDWIIYRAKQIPGPLTYTPQLIQSKGGLKISDANPKTYLEWAEYYSKQTPGPSEYDINLCL